MIARLRGTLVAKDAEGALIDCGGVGYGVAMSVTALARLPAAEAPVTVLVHTHVTEDAIRLFAFVDASERSAFLTLIGSPGVGPRLALAILSTLSVQELADAVELGDKAALTRIPGVGSKKAERLLVELKGRLHAPVTLGAIAGGPRTVRADLLSALANLGFAPMVAERAANEALSQQPQASDLPLLLREALRATTAPLKS